MGKEFGIPPPCDITGSTEPSFGNIPFSAINNTPGLKDGFMEQDEWGASATVEQFFQKNPDHPFTRRWRDKFTSPRGFCGSSISLRGNYIGE